MEPQPPAEARQSAGGFSTLPALAGQSNGTNGTNGTNNLSSTIKDD
ncbi:MAG: hypothetical protein GYB31_07825 [Bacteroidetes bacterium]|nr:hypothetical protein [Bacteroidota bacterium]